MSLSRDFNKRQLTNREIRDYNRRAIVAEVHNSTLTAAQDALLSKIGHSGVFDAAAQAIIFTIPEGADKKDLKAALKQLDLDTLPDLKIKLVRDMPRDPNIVAKTSKSALRKYAAEHGMLASRTVQGMLGAQKSRAKAAPKP